MNGAAKSGGAAARGAGGPVRAVVFDLDGTLVDLGIGRVRFAREIAGGCLGHGESHRAEGSSLDTGGTARAFCARLAEKSGGEAREIHARYVRRIASLVEAAPGLEEMMRALAGRVRLAVVSNGSSRVQRGKLARAAGAWARAFDPVVVSGEFGRAKPCGAIFEEAVRGLGVAAAECLFVGDDPVADIAGAAGAGMRTCLIGARAGEAGIEPEERVMSLAEVASVAWEVHA